MNEEQLDIQVKRTLAFALSTAASFGWKQIDIEDFVVSFLNGDAEIV